MATKKRAARRTLKERARAITGKTQQTEKISHRIPGFEACINLRLNLLTTLPLSP